MQEGGGGLGGEATFRPRPRPRRMRKLALIIPLLVIVAAWMGGAASLWMSVEGPPMPAAGYVAMWLGIAFSLVIGCGLMMLMFYSSRRGYDERAGGEEIERRPPSG